MKNIKDLKPSRNSRYKQGSYKPINPKKYVGEYPIIYRSSWEYIFMTWCDNNSNVLKWSSESVKIEYKLPNENKTRMYNPDFLIEVKNSKDEVKQYIVEIKPKSDYLTPLIFEGYKTEAKLKAFHKKQETQFINKWKFIYATEYAKDRGMEFTVVNEDFFNNNSKRI